MYGAHVDSWSGRPQALRTLGKAEVNGAQARTASAQALGQQVQEQESASSCVGNSEFGLCLDWG